MKLEIRNFKNARHLLLIPESDGEVAMIDNYFGDDPATYNCSRIMVTLNISDDFKPYIRVETPDRLLPL